MKCTENYVKLNFLSRSSNESSAKVAADFAAQLDPTLDELEDMKITVRKTFTNAIVHAYPDRLGKTAEAANRRGRHPGDHGPGLGSGHRGRRPGNVAPLYHRRHRAKRHGLYHHGEIHG